MSDCCRKLRNAAQSKITSGWISLDSGQSRNRVRIKTMQTNFKRADCGNNPSPALDLQDEQLQLVFGHLSEAKDFVRCSAVSKAWGQAVKSTKPTQLVIKHCGGKEEARAQLRWLQGMQKADCFKDLQSALMDDYNGNPDPSQGQSSVLSQG